MLFSCTATNQLYISFLGYSEVLKFNFEFWREEDLEILFKEVYFDTFEYKEEFLNNKFWNVENVRSTKELDIINPQFLSFSPFFNQKDISIGPNVRILKLGMYFNAPLYLPPGIEVFTMGHNFNQNIELPKSLRILSTGDEYVKPLFLSEGLIELDIKNEMNLGYPLPKSLEILFFSFYSSFNCAILLPENLHSLTLNQIYNQPLLLPSRLRKLHLGYYYNRPIDLPTSLEELRLGYHFNQKLVLPDSLSVLVLSFSFNQEMELPRNLLHLEIGKNFNRPLHLPPQLKVLNFHWATVFCHDLVLPSSLKSVNWHLAVSPLITFYVDCDFDTSILNNKMVYKVV